MRKVKLFIASSLDGFIAREDGSIDWLFDDADYGYAKFYDSIDAVMIGRKTYEQALGFEQSPFKGKEVYVFTRSPGKKEGNAEFIADPAGFTQKTVSQQRGRDIWLVGGAGIIAPLLNADLVDEIILSIHPVILGKGIPLFKDIEGQHDLKLVDSKAYSSGLAQLRYEVVHA